MPEPTRDKTELLEQATAATGPLTPRALLVFAHPDDETLALGARLGRFVDAHLVTVTDGAPRDERDCHQHGFPTLAAYREARRQELAAALQCAGAAALPCESLDIPDQEAALHLAEVIDQLRRLLDATEPAVIFTHPYEGGHPDHDACAFAVQQAVALAGRRNRPLIVEAPFYHLGLSGMQTGAFADIGRGVEVERMLSAEEQQRKRDLLACFRTQRETLGQFGVSVERFRESPGYDFREPPNGGAVLYDTWGWQMTSTRFVELAREAMARLTPVPACR